MAFYRIKPILGTKTDVPIDDESLIMPSGSVALTYDVGGQNVDYERKMNACTKSFGFSEWSNSTSMGALINGMFELDDGTNRDNLLFVGGRVYYYDGSKDPVRIQGFKITYSSLAGGPAAAAETVTGDTTATVATVVTGISAAAGTLYVSDITGGTGDFSASESLTFSGGATADCDSVLTNVALNNGSREAYSVIRYGSSVIFADWGANTPQRWANGDANFVNLITGTNATLYKFRYLAEWYLHIIGLYSDQTNGDIDIRWTEALPGADVTFPAANQIYTSGRDSITGVSRIGSNNLLIYGTDSISRLDYYPSAKPAFGITTLLDGQGAACNSSIINAYGANWFFNKNYGFVRYSGGSRILATDVISRDIEPIIQGIDARYYGAIVGTAIPGKRQLVWSVPTAGASTVNALLYFDVETGKWSKETKSFTYIDAWTKANGERKELVMSSSSGRVYESDGESAAWTNYSHLWRGHRIEPAMHFGDPKKKKILKAVWFGIIEGGDYSIDLYHRGGDTVKELEGQSWQYVGSLNLNNPDPPVIYMPSLMVAVAYDNLSGGTYSVGDPIYITDDYDTVIGTVLCDERSETSTEGTLYLSQTTSRSIANDEQLGNELLVDVYCDAVGASTETVITLSARYHQIKWGTDEADEKFAVNWLEYEFEMTDDY